VPVRYRKTLAYVVAIVIVTLVVIVIVLDNTLRAKGHH
jgi:hypothetical protein